MTRQDHDGEVERDLHLLIEAYLDGSIEAEGAARLAGVLRSPSPAAAAIRSRLAFAGLLGQALDDASSDDVARAVNERIDAQGESSGFERRVMQVLPVRPHGIRRRPHSWLPRLDAAAMVVLAIGAAWWILPRHRQDETLTGTCHLLTRTAGTIIARAGTRFDATGDTALEPGDAIIAAGPATLHYTDGTTVTVATGTHLSLHAIFPGKRLSLESGSLDAEVAPQPVNHPVVLSTSEGQVDVVGTHFLLVAAPQSTRLDLTHGTVRFTRSSDGRSLTVHAGETASIAVDSDFAVHPLPAPALAASAGVAGPFTTDRPLFPASGLAGWDQQHGVWSLAEGVVHGSGAGGSARLLSQRAFSDLVLTCRLRLHDVDHAEVQVGDYNWFFTVRSASRAWIALRLEQHGNRLHCTADGVALTAEAGAGQAARPGPLAFYLMTGSLDIADARITTDP
jgi:ferric-dicitrate binding protein FerR (iron transport regulator)